MKTPPTHKLLPRLVEPRKLALQGTALLGSLTAKQLPRLADVVERVAKPAEVSLGFYIDDYSKKVVKGEVDVEVYLPCQRCLQPFQYTLQSSFEVAVVFTDEEAEQLPKHLEPWVVPEFEGDLHQLVEEEILLALPFVAMHPESECSGFKLVDDLSDTDEKGSASEKANPFSVLAQLKGK